MKIEKAIEIVKNNSALKFPSKVSHKEYQEALNQVLDVCKIAIDKKLVNEVNEIAIDDEKYKLKTPKYFPKDCKKEELNYYLSNVDAVKVSKVSEIKTRRTTYKLPKPIYCDIGNTEMEAIVDIFAQILNLEEVKKDE